MVSFPVMSEILKPAESDHFEIRHIAITKEDLELCILRDAINGRRDYLGQKPGTIVQLVRKPALIMMSDTAMERRTSYDILWHATGHVLIAGLGLGMVALGIQGKEDVESVTVIEIEPEIIDLVVPQLPLNEKVAVVGGDIFTWYPPNGVKFDTIYFDIWDSMCADNYEEMKRLKRRFARRLNRENPHCWMKCWWEDECRREIRRGVHYSWL
jgi:hypothetical protein